MQSNFIDKLIEGRKIIEEAQAAAKKEERKKLVEERLEALKTYLGEFWIVLEHKAEEEERPFEYSVSWNGDVPEISFDLPDFPDLSLAPIEIKWGRHANNQGYYHYNEIFRVWGHYYHDLAQALKAARDVYPDYLKDARNKRIEWYNQETRFHKNPRKTEEEIRLLIDQCKAEFPDKADQADKILAEWLRLRDEEIARDEERRRREEEQEAEEALKKTLRLGYVSDLAQWLAVRDATQEENQKTAQAIQDVSDSRKYTVYKLTYALIARDDPEEGFEDYASDPHLETKSVYTLYNAPDEEGFWFVGLEKTPIKFFNPVDLERMDVKASSGILAKHIKKAGIDFYFAPNVLDEKLPEILADIQELPEEPKPAEELGYIPDYERRRYIEGARALLNGEEASEGDLAPF